MDRRTLLTGAAALPLTPPAAFAARAPDGTPDWDAIAGQYEGRAKSCSSSTAIGG